MNSSPLDQLIAEQVSHWLKLWHHRQSSDRVGQGYPSTAAGCGMYRASKQYDDSNGAMDLAADIAEADAVDSVIRKMTPTHQALLALEARNLCSTRVWSSARISAQDVKLIMQEARQLLWDGMRNAGLA